MRGNIDIIKNAAQNILNQIPDKNQLIWININAGIQFKGLKEEFSLGKLEYTELKTAMILIAAFVSRRRALAALAQKVLVTVDLNLVSTTNIYLKKIKLFLFLVL